jgi:hypothetical protein
MTKDKVIFAWIFLAPFHIPTEGMAVVSLVLCNLLKLETIRSAIEKGHINLFRL